MSVIRDMSSTLDFVSLVATLMSSMLMETASASLDTISLATVAEFARQLRPTMLLTESAESDARPTKFGTQLLELADACPVITWLAVSAHNATPPPKSTTKNFNAVTASKATKKSQAKAATASALPSATSTKIGSQADASASQDIT